MQEFLANLYYDQTVPAISAIALGLMTAIAPCPLTTNIAAIGFLSRDLSSKRKVFLNGLFYTLGLAIAYTGIATILYFGAGKLRIADLLQRFGGKILGPVLLLIGLIMLDIIRFNLPQFYRITARMKNRQDLSFIHVILLGIILAMAFCPYNGALYFGMLIPLTINTEAGLYLPLLFSVAAGIPIIIFSWLLAFTVSGAGRLYRNVKVFERWFRRIIAFLFIGIGIYYIWIYWISHLVG